MLGIWHRVAVPVGLSKKLLNQLNVEKNVHTKASIDFHALVHIEIAKQNILEFLIPGVLPVFKQAGARMVPALRRTMESDCIRQNIP